MFIPPFLFQDIISKNSSPDSGGGPLAPAFLLSIMIDHASKHLDPALTPQILLKSANLIKEIVWVSSRKQFHIHIFKRSVRFPTRKCNESSHGPLFYVMSALSLSLSFPVISLWFAL